MIIIDKILKFFYKNTAQPNSLKIKREKSDY